VDDHEVLGDGWPRFPCLIRHYGFWGAMGASVVVAIACSVGFAYLIRGMGVDLLGEGSRGVRLESDDR